MAKLPDIQYLSNTPSLGRQDISLPGKIARSKAALYQSVSGVVIDLGETIITQKMGEGVAGAQAELTQLKTTLLRDRVTDVESFELEAGVDYKPTDVNGEPIKSISSHTVMEKVWSEGVKDIVGKHTEDMPAPFRRQVQQKLAGSIAKMGGMVGAQAYKWRTDEINAVAHEQVRKLTNSATFEIKDEVKMQVSAVINDQVRSGFIGAEEGVKMSADARSKVDYNVLLQQIVLGGRGDLDQVEEMLARPPADTGLEITLPQRRSLYTRLDARNKRLETNREKTEKLEQERYVTNTLIDIQENGNKPWDEIRKMTPNMPPASARLVVTLNQAKMDAQAEEDEEGDDAIYAGIESRILGAVLAPLGEGVSPQVMKDVLTNEIQLALAMHQSGQPGITADEAHTLYGRIDGAMKQKMNIPGLGMAKEQLSGYITKGSVANQGMRNNGAQVMKYNEAIRDLYNAIRLGETSDPMAWVAQNKDNYLSGTAVVNMDKADVAIAERYLIPANVSDTTRPADAPTFNTSASLEAARAAYDAGTISAPVYQMTVDYIRDRRAEHMEMLKRRAEKGNQ